MGCFAFCSRTIPAAASLSGTATAFPALAWPAWADAGTPYQRSADLAKDFRFLFVY